MILHQVNRVAGLLPRAFTLRTCIGLRGQRGVYCRTQRLCGYRAQSVRTVSRMSVREVIVSDNTRYTIHPLQDTDIPLIPNIIHTAAQLANNVAQDEFNQQKIDQLISWSDVFTVNRSPEELVGFIFLHPSFHCRRLIAHVGFFQIFLAHGDSSDVVELYRKLVTLSVQMTVTSRRGYVGVMTSLFSTCSVWLQQLKEEKFFITASIPFCGRVRGREDQESYLIYRPLMGEDIQGQVKILTIVMVC